MKAVPYTFNGVSLLITHYNRSASLARLLQGFEDLGCRFEEVIVSDDASRPEHFQELERLQNQYHFRLVSTPVNKGLANNLNKGQAAVKTPYVLYVQEDFTPTEKFPQEFTESISLMEKDPSLDIVRYYAYEKYPYLKPYAGAFMELVYRPWFTNTHKIYCYSDHPHLRRRNFAERFGPYTEGIKSDRGEYRMCISFIRNKGKGLFYKDYKSLFIQENSAAEPSTVKRSEWRNSGNPLVGMVRQLYRQIRYNYDLHIAPR